MICTCKTQTNCASKIVKYYGNLLKNELNMMHSSDLEEGRLTTAAHHSHRNKRTEGETHKDNMHTGEVPRGEDTSPNIWNESERSRDGPAQRGPGLKEKRHTDPRFTQKFSRNVKMIFRTFRVAQPRVFELSLETGE